MNTKAVAYLRVSTDGQIGEDRFGLAMQKEDIIKYSKANNIGIIHFYIEEGVSGSKLDRPELNAIIKEAEKKEFNAVIVAKLDRIARDLMAQLWIEKELLKHNIEIISVAEPMRADDSTGKLFRQIIGAFAEFEKARITERMTGGRIQKAKQGNYAGGRPAIGYISDKQNKALAVNKEKVQTIKRVFELKLQGLTLEAIAEQLNKEEHTTAQGKPFFKMQVKRILDRKEFYKGLYSYADVSCSGNHPAII